MRFAPVLQTAGGGTWLPQPHELSVRCSGEGGKEERRRERNEDNMERQNGELIREGNLRLIG